MAESRETDAWAGCLEDVASLLDHPKSLVRNRALHILAAHARWDEENRLDRILPDMLRHIADETGMLPAAFPTERCKSRCFAAEAGAL